MHIYICVLEYNIYLFVYLHSTLSAFSFTFVYIYLCTCRKNKKKKKLFCRKNTCFSFIGTEISKRNGESWNLKRLCLL